MGRNVWTLSALVLSMSGVALPAFAQSAEKPQEARQVAQETPAAASEAPAVAEEGAPGDETTGAAEDGAPAKEATAAAEDGTVAEEATAAAEDGTVAEEATAAAEDGAEATAEAPTETGASATDAPDATEALAAASPPDLTGDSALESNQIAPQAVLARGPTQGRPLVVRRGFFTDTNLGTFFTLGGNDQYSNAQSYVQLGLGYDLFDFLELGAHVAFGSNAFNCFAGRIGGACARSDAFTVTFFDLSVAYLHRLGDRLYLAPKVVAGYTLLDPEPISGQSRGFNVGAGIGVEYATAMDHFSVGAEVLGRFVLGANIPSIAIFPRVKYTF